MMDKEPIDFEAKMIELGQIVEAMEQQALTLEQSLEYFKRGITITQQCQRALQQAEQTVQILTMQDTQNTGES